MHTAARSAETCWLILPWTAWRLSFEGVQYARSVVGIQLARVLLAALASGSFARFRCDVFHFFLHDVFHFCFPYALKNSFATLLVLFLRWQQQSNCTRTYERRLSAFRDNRSIRIAITVPRQYHQHKSLVSLFLAIAELSRYDAIIYVFAVPASVCPFGFRNS